MDEEPFIIEVTDVLDLHSFAPQDVKRVVNEYLRIAHEKKFQVVRIIHGKGIGVQREIVRKVLSETDFVIEYANAPMFSGHWGATVVQLSIID